MNSVSEGLDDIGAAVAARIAIEQQLLPPPDPVEPGDEITSEFIRECLGNNEVGDGTLYANLHRDKYVYVKKNQEWLHFSGHYWEQDIYDLHLRAVGSVADHYNDEAVRLKLPISRLQAEEKELTAQISACESRAKELLNSSKSAEPGATTTEISAINDEIVSLKNRRMNILNEIASCGLAKKALERRVDRLKGKRGADNCVYWAHIVDNPLAISGDELDQHPLLLPCANGVVNLQTGELRPGKPSDWLSKGVSIDYLGFDTPAPAWDGFMHSLFEDDVVEFVQELFGYCASGLTLEQFIAVHVGKGRNGKGVLFEMLEQAMGPLYWTVQSELLLDNKTSRSSSSASPDILALRGRRLAAASETDQGRRISAARVKELTGSDTLNARLLYDKADTNFRPTHKLHLRTNEVPAGLTKDFALRERLIYLKYRYMFVDDPEQKAKEDPNNAEHYRLKDRGLKERLGKELPGILAWLVRGFAKWQKRGKLIIPESCLKDAQKLEQDEDMVGQFLAACTQTEDRRQYIAFKTVYDTFAWWFADTQDARKDNTPSKKWFGKELDKRGFRRDTSGGTAWVYGLSLTVNIPSQSGWGEHP